MLSSDTNPSFYCKVHTSNIRLTFTSPYVAKLCDGDAYCFSGTTKTLTATFSLNPFYDDLSYNKYIRSVGTMGAQISGAFNPCYAYGANLNFTSLTSLHVNGQPILLQRKNLGQDIVSTTCADKGSCSKTFSAAASMLEAGFSTDLNITQQGNEVTFEFEGTSSPTTYLCVKQLELRLCSIPKTTTVVSYTAQITSTTPSVLNFVTNDTVWALQNEPFPNSKELLKSYSDQFVRRVKITNPALAFSPEFSLIINPSMYQFMPSMTIDVVSVNKTFTDPVTNQVLTINISESVTLKRSSSRYELTFNTSLWKDDEISLDIRISLVSPYSNSGFGYFSYDVSPLDTSKNAYYNTRPYGAVQDQFSYTSRQIFNINYNTPQKITALGKLSDVVAVNYSPDPNTPSMDGQMPLCYMQINTIFPDNVFEFSGTIYFYSTKTNKQYSANFGPSYTIDPNKKQAQYFISSEMLDCTQGSSTMIYVWLEILTIDKYYESGVITTQVSASRKSIQLIDDANKVYSDLSFSSKYDGTVYYVKSFSSLKFPYDLTVSTTYSSLDAPFLSFLSYSVPLSWADQKPMILQSTKAPSSSTDFAAYDVDVTVGMFFTFIEKGVCSIYPCRASFKFSVSQDLVNPPTLSTTPSNTLTITKSGYRSNGFLTAVEIPQTNSVVSRNVQATQSNVLYNLKVIAAIKVDSQPRLFTITRPLALQVSKQYDTTQNAPFNSTYSQQVASQNYITYYTCTNTYDTHYLIVNAVIQNANDYGKWYISFFSHPEVSYKVTYTIHLMNNIFSVATTTNGANLPILYSPISSIVYGLRLNTQATSGQANLMISLDANSLYLSRDNQYEILFKHGSIPTDTDYDVKSPVLRNDAKYPYQKFVTRFIYGQNVILSYVMDNTYYTNADMRKSFPSSMYSSKVVSDGSNFSNGIVYFLIKATPISENMCISESNLDIPNSYIVGQYQYSSSLMITEGSYKKINSQVMALDLSKKDLPPNSEVVADFNQETATTIFSSNPSILYYNAKTKAVQSSSDNDNNSGTSSTQMAFHNLTYLPFGPPFKTVYYSFKYTIRMKIENDNNAKNSQFFILFPVSLNGFLSPANNYDAMVGVNSKYDPNKYFIDLISPTIIVGSIFGAFLALIAIGYLIAACAFVMTSQKREFNLGTLKPKIWLACLFPASIPVSICYVYFFLYEGRKNILAPPEIKRRRRVRFLITFSIISFVIGVLACAYFFGRLFFIHAQSVASANSREYVLGKKTPKSESFSPPIYTPKLMPCCSATRPSTDGKDAQSFTYFGTSQAFFSQKYGGRLDCAPPQWFMDSELGTKFVLQSIDGLPYVPPEHDPAIAAANSKNGRSSTFEMATTYCMANSVILMPVDDDFNAYGIPGVLFGIGPILYAFFLMSIVVFESFMKKSSSNGTTIQNYVIGQPPTNGYGENETNEDKTTLLIDDEARNSIYAVHPSAPLTYDNTMTAEPYYGNVQNNSEAEEEYREPPAQQSTSQFMTKE